MKKLLIWFNILAVFILCSCLGKPKDIVVNVEQKDLQLNIEDGYSFRNNVQPSFQWNTNGENLYYTIQISDSEDFSTINNEQTIFDNDSIRISKPLSQNRDVYYIRLGSSVEENREPSNWSKTLSFHILLTPPEPTEENLVLAFGKEKYIPIKNADNAEIVSLQIADNSDFSNIAFSQDYIKSEINNNRISLDNIKLHGDYYIRFKTTFQGSNNTTVWSQPYSIFIEGGLLGYSAIDTSFHSDDRKTILYQYIEDGGLSKAHIIPDISPYIYQDSSENWHLNRLSIADGKRCEKLILADLTSHGVLTSETEILLPGAWQDINRIRKAQTVTADKTIVLNLLSSDRQSSQSILSVYSNGENDWITIDREMLTEAAINITGEDPVYSPDIIRIRDFLLLDENTLLICGNYSNNQNENCVGWLASIDLDNHNILAYHEDKRDLESSVEAIFQEEDGLFCIALEGESLSPRNNSEQDIIIYSLFPNGDALTMEKTWTSRVRPAIKEGKYDSLNPWERIGLRNTFMIDGNLYFMLNIYNDTVFTLNREREGLDYFDFVSQFQDFDNNWLFELDRIIPINQNGMLQFLITGTGLLKSGPNISAVTNFVCTFDSKKMEILSMQSENPGDEIPMAVYLNGDIPPRPTAFE